MKQFSILSLLTLVFIFTLATPSLWAQDDSKKRIVKQGKTVYDFDEVDIMGKLKKPEGGVVVEAPEFRFRRLLDLDESFLPNIIRSVDEF